MAARQKNPSSPKVLRIEAMPLDFGEAAIVIELDAEPPKRWFKALKREMTYSEGLETASAKFDGCFVYLVGLEPALGSAVRCASRLLAAVQEGLEQKGTGSPESDPAADDALHVAASLHVPLSARGEMRP
ncbi:MULTISPECIES: hypothetical protein [unclassified Stenotrophomonas]|uniref:hypothetical protein n=1 Tax=unclassified Stenotrophomonas TaxID=196198 RepID=UPI0021192B67|nr:MULTISPECIES: hypothetical protein [unclassified Stenotrophomonas]